MLNRRNFLAGLGALVGGLAIQEAIPLGRVWSFPSKIVVPQSRVINDSDDKILSATFQENDILSFGGGVPGFPPNQLFQLRGGVLHPYTLVPICREDGRIDYVPLNSDLTNSPLQA